MRGRTGATPKRLTGIVSMAALLAATAPGRLAALDPNNEVADPVRPSPVVLSAEHHDVSPPLASLDVSETAPTRGAMPEHRVPPDINRLPEGWRGATAMRGSAPVQQITPGARAPMPDPLVNVEGLGKGTPGYAWLTPPPDTTGAVGPEHYLQWVNTHFMLFSKSDGSVIDLPGNDWRAGNTLWTGFGGPCEAQNDGDPIVLYDQLAGRWFMSQLAVHQSFPLGPFYQCIAVSTSDDPLGTWHRYSWVWPDNKLNDYPKFAVWPDGYYLTVNEFREGNLAWEGAGVAILERHRMLEGEPAQMVYWNLPTDYGALLPADLDGPSEPPPGSSGYVVGLHIGDDDHLNLWRAAVDWADPGSSTLGDVDNNPDVVIPVSNIVPAAQIDQPGTTNLDVIADRLMFRAPYRNLGSHESLLLNHTVGAPAGIRWYEIRDLASTPVLHQEGTFTPDSEHRWMGALAMDGSGNIALGYSLAGPTIAPSVRVTGRLADDPPGLMTLTEFHVQDGAGAQIGSSRWGDYSTMAVDPSDDCTLWYTQEYTNSSGPYVWQTRVAAFRFASCERLPTLFIDGFESGDTTRWSVSAP